MKKAGEASQLEAKLASTEGRAREQAELMGEMQERTHSIEGIVEQVSSGGVGGSVLSCVILEDRRGRE